MREETGVEIGELQPRGRLFRSRSAIRAAIRSALPISSRLPGEATPHAGDDAAAAEWVEDWRKHTLAFDHAQILADAEDLADTLP